MQFNLPEGYRIANKYEVLDLLGSGWEGESYKLVELRTGIERAAKLFYPERNRGNRTSRRYAKKLHKLRHCPILIQYHTEETMLIDGTPITALISEYVEGTPLSEFIRSMPGKRLTPFEAVHLLYALVSGVEAIHQLDEYHGDIHSDNIIINRYGLSFDIKMIDFYHWEATKKENRQQDIIDIVKVFHETLGGSRHYAKLPQATKYICAGLKHSLILERFRTLSHLRYHLETMEW